MNIHFISNEHLSIDDINAIVNNNALLALSEDAKERIIKCRQYLDNKMETHEEPIYGINTGFGSLYKHSISKKDLGSLQKNLVMSHACGTGDEVPSEVVRLMIFLKIQSLAYGHSGVQLQTVERLIDFYNEGIYPVVYQQGSLGASGDLSPLAHLSLPLLGLGEAYFQGKKTAAADIMAHFDWQPIALQSKEGLALLNGTQFMSAYAVHTLVEANKINFLSDLIGAVSLDAYDGRIEPFHPKVHEIRAHQGQIDTAAFIREVLEGSELITRHKTHVQDPYSFRCMPQVHGASKDAIDYVYNVVETEINSTTDNPNVFPDDDLIISAGNFHGQPLALAMDMLSLALHELGNISERRTYKLISGQRELPSFLVATPGLNSGFMIPQYTAASIVSQSKHLCMPASADSIPSSQGQEDHVSMGANAATKVYKIAENTQRVLAIELFNAAQALEFRRPAKSSPIIEEFVAAYREEVAFVEQDKVMHDEIKKSIAFLKSIEIEDAMETVEEQA